MKTDRERWDERHRVERARPARAPDGFVVEVLHALGPGAGRRALDLACGTGRHALLLAQLGWATEAWDVSPVALEVLAERARASGLGVETRAVDLCDRWPELDPPDLLVVVDFLDRALYAALPSRVRPGGSVVLATFTEDWPEAHPSPRFRLKNGELSAGVPGLRTLGSVESGGRAGLWARREDS
ncbi:MAG: methyltransferase domain-containing protein [Myxococcales bacterium]|nr:methyltransferase domain-containing protein [Myxococcales bacterium]